MLPPGIIACFRSVLLLCGSRQPSPLGSRTARSKVGPARAVRAWTSAANGSTLPMYGLFALCLAVFLVGVYRQIQGAGSRCRRRRVRSVRHRSAFRRLARLCELGLQQKRLLQPRYSAWTHLLLFWGFVVLALGSLTIMVDSLWTAAVGLPASARELGYRVFQATALDAFGLALLGGVVLALYRRLWNAARPHAGQRGDACSSCSCCSAWGCPASSWKDCASGSRGRPSPGRSPATRLRSSSRLRGRRRSTACCCTSSSGGATPRSPSG